MGHLAHDAATSGRRLSAKRTRGVEDPELVMGAVTSGGVTLLLVFRKRSGEQL